MMASGAALGMITSTSHFLANGPYISAIARSLALQHSLVQLAVDLPEWDFPISLVTLRNCTLPPVVERFIESARSAAREFADPRDLRSPSRRRHLDDAKVRRGLC
jgi:hypothetical protein